MCISKIFVHIFKKTILQRSRQGGTGNNPKPYCKQYTLTPHVQLSKDIAFPLCNLLLQERQFIKNI